MTETVKDEIQNAINILGFEKSIIRLLPDEEGCIVYKKVVEYFVNSGDRRWWWEDFRFSSTNLHLKDQNGFEQIIKIVPDKQERVWFIVEDDQLPFYPVYEATPEAVQSIIGESYGFEYYLIAKDFSWLLCETHHNNLVAIGSQIEEKLVKINV